MKKVLIIAYDFNPDIGSEAGVSYIWSEIIQSQYKIVIYTQERHKRDLAQYGCTFDLRYIKSTPGLSKILRQLNLYNYDYSIFIRKVAKIIAADIEVDNTLIHFLSPFGIHSYSDLALNCGLPYVVGPIGGYLKMPRGFEAYKTIDVTLKEFFYSRLLAKPAWRNYFANASAIICGTELVKAHLPLEAQQRVSIIYDSVVDTTFFNAEARRDSKEKLVIIFTGRLVLFKGCFLLLKAFENLLNKGYQNIELVFAGDGLEQENLNSYISSHNMGHAVRMLGRINRDQLKCELLNANIYCLPTLKDNGGNALFEAMACSLPVVTSNYGGPAFSVTPECGFLIDPINIEDYIKKLTQVLETLIGDQALRESMGQKAREHVVNSYSAASLKRKLLEFYDKIMQ